MTNRYKELLAEVPVGSFYASVGQIIPYRTGPYEFLLTGVPASSTFSVTVNDQFQGVVTSDVNGNINLSLALGLGRQDVIVEGSGIRVPTYLDVRTWATIFAAHAAVIGGIDQGLDDVESALALETATSGYLGDAYGQLVWQPDDLSTWLLDSYRGLVRRLRQGFRLYGSKLEGLRQVVSAYTASLPRRMNDFRPRWILGPAEGSVFAFTRLITGGAGALYNAAFNPATGVNQRSVAYVHPSLLASAANTFPGPFTSPPEPTVLVVTFSAGWDGGAVTLSGTAPDGAPLSETFNYTGPGLERVTGTKTFLTVTAGVKATVGATGTVRVGVPQGFVTVVDVDDYNPIGALDIDFSTAPERLQWDLGPTFDVSATSPLLVDGRGRITLRRPDRVPSWIGLTASNGAGYAFGDDSFIALEVDNRGIILANLANTYFGGAASPQNAAQVATTLNEYIERDTRYGAVRATGSLTCNPGATLNGDTFTLDDGPHAAVTFTYTTGVAAPPFIVITLLDTAAQVAVKTRDVINAQYNNLRIAASIDPTDATRVLLVNDYGGTQGNVTITSAGAPFVATTGMSGGVNGMVGAALAVADGDGLGDYVYLEAVNGVAGAAGVMRVWPTGADAAPVVLGLPRRQAALASLAAFRSVVLDLPTPNRLPGVAEVVVLHDAVLDTTTTTSSGFSTPSRPRAVEVVFDAAWRNGGGIVNVFGTDVSGAAISESFTATPTVVMTGSGTGDGTGHVTASTGSFAAVTPGMFLELTTGSPGAGAFIRRVWSTTELDLAMPYAAFGSASFRVLSAPAPATGTQAFASASMWTNTAPQAARTWGPAGSATLSVIDGVTYGYAARVGRALRTTSGPGDTLTALTPDNTATLLMTPDWEHADVGGYVLIAGETAENGTNNGLHLITGLGTTGDLLYLRHGEYDRGGRFFSGVLLNATRIYSAGEVVRVVKKDTGDLTLFPPGVQRSTTWPLGARVEDEVEMPLVVPGIDGAGLTVDVDRTYVPATAQTSSLTLTGTYVPDGWRAYNVTGTGQDPGLVRPRRVLFDVNAAGFALERRFDVEAFRGHTLSARFWAQQHKGPAPGVTRNLQVRFSFDDGASWVTGTVPAGAVALSGAAAANPQPVVATGLTSVLFQEDANGSLDPSVIYGEVLVPYDATDVLLRLEDTTLVTTRISVEGCIVAALPTSWLASSTIIRSEHRSKFGELLYVWSPELLTDAERDALGLEVVSPTSAATRGQIDRVVNAHGIWDRVDVSEYSGGDAVNVRGTYTDVDWLGATLTNMEIVVGTPPRTSYIRPLYISLVENEPLVVVAPSNATLAETSAHGSAEAFIEEVLLADGVPVPATPLNTTTVGTAGAVGAPDANGYQLLTDGTANFPTSVVGRSITLAGTASAANDGVWIVVERPSTTTLRFDNPGGAAAAIAPGTYTYNADGVLPWRFLSSTVVQIASVAAGDPAAQAVFDSAANYVLSYRRLIQAVPGPFDLGASYADYVWFVDAVIWRRTEPSSTPFSQTESLVFFANFEATLSVAADTTATAVLTRDNGLSATVVAAANWSFVDSRTVRIASTVFDAASIYTLTYVGLEPEFVRPAEVVLEMRSSNVSLADVLLQSWRTVTIDEVAPNVRFHQVRATLSNIIRGPVERGTATVDGRIVTGTFGPAVTAGRVFRVTTGANAGTSAHILSVATGQLTLDTIIGSGESFTADYEVRTSIYGTDVEISSLGLRGINLSTAPGIA